MGGIGVEDALADPVLNGPFDPPSRYFELGRKGPTGKIIAGRRPSESFIPVPQTKKRGKKAAADIQDALDFDLTHENIEKNTLIGVGVLRLGGQTVQLSSGLGHRGTLLSPAKKW